MTIGAFLLQAGGGVGVSVPGLVLRASPFSKLILILLLVVSVYSWAIVWMRSRVFGAAFKADRGFLDAFRRMAPDAELGGLVRQFPKATLAAVAEAGLRTLASPSSATLPAIERVDLARRAMERAASHETARLEYQVGFLATTGSVTPFVGLLGTVWGVMSSFLSIGGAGSASLAVVAPGIAEALIATVAGLATAIPAVVAYNHFLGKVRENANAMAEFASEFLDRRVYGADR
jgi:biopolymer transport protein TolQ